MEFAQLVFRLSFFLKMKVSKKILTLAFKFDENHLYTQDDQMVQESLNNFYGNTARGKALVETAKKPLFGSTERVGSLDENRHYNEMIFNGKSYNEITKPIGVEPKKFEDIFKVK